jgi:hypothetical protein
MSQQPDFARDVENPQHSDGVKVTLAPAPTNIGSGGLAFESFKMRDRVGIWTKASVLRILRSALFDNVMIVAILLNCAFMGASDPLCESLNEDGSPCAANCRIWRPVVGEDGSSHECDQTLLRTLEVSDLTFIVIFTVEMALQMFAVGIVGYFRVAWNWLDFTVVMTGWLNYLPGIPNISLLRIVKIIRPLRTVKRIKGMAALIVAFMGAIKPLASVASILLVFMSLTSIIGVNLFQGKLHSYCVPPSVKAATNGSNATLLNADWYSIANLCCNDPEEACPSGLGGCAQNWSCVTHDELGELLPSPTELGGTLSYDSFPSALLTSFQIITQEGW